MENTFVVSLGVIGLTSLLMLSGATWVLLRLWNTRKARARLPDVTNPLGDPTHPEL